MVIRYNPPDYVSETGDLETWFLTKDSDDLNEGDSNKYFDIQFKEEYRGFVKSELSKSTLSFDCSSKIFTLGHVEDYHVMVAGEFFTITGDKTLDLTGVVTTGDFIWIYLDTNCNLQYVKNDIPGFLPERALVAYLYYDGVVCLEYDERHLISRTALEHEAGHDGKGTLFGKESGFDIGSSLVPLGSPPDDQSSKIYLTEFEFYDEDRKHEVFNNNSPTELFQQILGDNLTDNAAKLPVMYLNGTKMKIWLNDSDRFAFYHDGVNGAPYWNENLMGSYTTSLPDNGSYVVYYVFGSNCQNYPVMLLMGQQQYSTLAAAQAANLKGFNWGNFKPAEGVVGWKLIYQHRTNYTLATHRCKMVDRDDLRDEPFKQLTGSTLHNTFQNLGFIEAGHTGFQKYTYISTIDPGAGNDGVDSDGIGHSFLPGYLWLNSSTQCLFYCVVNSTGAAVWSQLKCTDYIELVSTEFVVKTGNALTFNQSSQTWFTLNIYQNPAGNGDTREKNIFLNKGTYNFRLFARDGNNRGVLKFYVDDVYVDEQDYYVLAGNNNVITDFSFTVSASKTVNLKLKVDGKNIGSSDYLAHYSKIIITKTG